MRWSRPTEQPSTLQIGILLYALAGGVLWWSFHLVALAAYTPSVCDSRPRWVFSVINAVSIVGVLTALAASWLVIQRSQRDDTMGRARFMGHIAALFNLIALALVVLESVPVYVLGSCG